MTGLKGPGVSIGWYECFFHIKQCWEPYASCSLGQWYSAKLLVVLLSIRPGVGMQRFLTLVHVFCLLSDVSLSKQGCD